MQPSQQALSNKKKELNVILKSLRTPEQIQAFLDETEYPGDDFYRCPVSVIHDQKANCLDGAFFAAACFREHGMPPYIVDLLPESGTDDDHLLAVYKKHGLWGAVAKSNFTGLRYREPIFKTIRELVLSYFENYYNTAGMKTLRGYTRPFNLARLDHLNWMTSDAGMELAEKELYNLKPIMLFKPETIAAFVTVDDRSLQSGLAGANPGGLFKVE